MTIGKKITLGFSSTLALLILIGGLSFWSTLQYLDTSGWVNHTHEVLEDLEAILSLMKDVETGQRGYLLTGNSSFLKPYREALRPTQKRRDNLRLLIKDNIPQTDLLERVLEPLIETRLRDAKGLIGDEKDSKNPSVDFATALARIQEGTDKKTMDDIRAVVLQMETAERELLKKREADARWSAWFTMITTGVGTLAALILVSVIAIYIVRSIAASVGTAVDQMASAGAEIQAGSAQQAAGAQEQAAAVTQTMTTVDEVTQTADQSAQRAKNVGDAVQRTLEIGKAGRKVVEESLVAMESVKEKVETTAENILMLAEQAQAIGDIIAAVNDIADQTNLLALNAAIEASRAGEHGKGFSVVAGEVKTLAERSKNSTTQVRQILGEIQKATNTAVLSTEEVTKGVAAAIKVGGQAGETIKTLADTLTETSQAVKQIAASVGQQATGMAQIHQAMKNIDQVAKQNTVATRQASQAAENLSQLGRQLAILIGK